MAWPRLQRAGCLLHRRVRRRHLARRLVVTAEAYVPMRCGEDVDDPARALQRDLAILAADVGEGDAARLQRLPERAREAVGLDALVRQHARSLLRVTVSKDGRGPDPARGRPSRWRAIAHV